MGFSVVGWEPSSDAGKHFRNNWWWWQPMQALILLTCADILTVEEMRELGLNDGHYYSAETAAAMASRLADIVADEKLWASYDKEIEEMLPEAYDCWSKDNVLEFVEFLRHCGGFEVF